MSTYVVTGAFGYSGRYIASRLLAAGHEVRTLTNSPKRQHSFGDQIAVFPLCFDDPQGLAHALNGADVLINTYWVRFNHRLFTHAQAVANTRKLFAAAKASGVQRIVHVSITNPSETSKLEYFSGKAKLEHALADLGVPYSILRPNVLFGGRDILVNNIAWALRHLPIFGVFGDGAYKLQPMHVEDFADLAVREAVATGNRTIDAIGPETFTYRELVKQVGEIIGKRRMIVGMPPSLGYVAATIIGWFVGDVMLTRDEIDGLMQGLLSTDSPPAGPTRLTDWARQHADELGRYYASEMARRRNRLSAYEQLQG
ncbi:MAG: NAD(P)H-binding protein [Phycisphaeraceae bacterium]|nr:NAD(P)H-binding protein [Phycisphaeraceae bacterium]